MQSKGYMSHQNTKFTRVPGHEVFSQRYDGNSSRQNKSNIWMTLKYKKYASYMIFLRIFPKIFLLFMAYSDFPDNIAVTKLKTKWCNTKHILQKIPKAMVDSSGTLMMCIKQ